MRDNSYLVNEDVNQKKDMTGVHGIKYKTNPKKLTKKRITECSQSQRTRKKNISGKNMLWCLQKRSN